MALMGKVHKPANRRQDFFSEVCRGCEVMIGNELPDFCDVLSCARVKLESLITGHFLEWIAAREARLPAASSLRRSARRQLFSHGEP